MEDRRSLASRSSILHFSSSIFYSIHLRRVGEHLDQIIVQIIEELALKVPGELLRSHLAVGNKEVILMDAYLKLWFDRDRHRHAARCCCRREVEERMLITPQFLTNSLDVLHANFSPPQSSFTRLSFKAIVRRPR